MLVRDEVCSEIGRGAGKSVGVQWGCGKVCGDAVGVQGNRWGQVVRWKCEYGRLGECGKRLMGCGKVGGVVRLLWSAWRGRLVRERGCREA